LRDKKGLCNCMGPTCEVTLRQLDGELLDEVHRHLKDVADEVVATRKRRVWDVWMEGHPIHVQADDESTGLWLAAGCNQPEDWAIIERLALSLANALGGQASKPVK
jgi:hypothetical protein